MTWDRLERVAATVAVRVPVARGLLWRAARWRAGRHHVGVVAVVLDGSGSVLVAGHRFRAARWALPGGWVHRHEDPAETIRRELLEELGASVDVIGVVATESHGTARETGRGPSGLTIAFACRPVPGGPEPAPRSAEITAAAWMSPSEAALDLTAFEQEAIAAALRLPASGT